MCLLRKREREMASQKKPRQLLKSLNRFKKIQKDQMTNELINTLTEQDNTDAITDNAPKEKQTVSR